MEVLAGIFGAAPSGSELLIHKDPLRHWLEQFGICVSMWIFVYSIYYLRNSAGCLD